MLPNLTDSSSVKISGNDRYWLRGFHGSVFSGMKGQLEHGPDWISTPTLRQIYGNIRTTAVLVDNVDERRLSSLLKAREKLKASLQWTRQSATSLQGSQHRISIPAALWSYDYAFDYAFLPFSGAAGADSPPPEFYSTASATYSVPVQAYLVPESPAPYFDQPTVNAGTVEARVEVWYRLIARIQLLRTIHRATLRRLRRVNERISLLLRQLGRLQRLREFVGRHRCWYVRHGAHPPRLSDLSLGPTNLPGAPV
jgi:hypothetical protein